MVLNALRRCGCFFNEDPNSFPLTKVYINTALHCLRVLGIDAPNCETYTLRGTRISEETVRSVVDDNKKVKSWYALPSEYKVERESDGVKLIE